MLQCRPVGARSYAYGVTSRLLAAARAAANRIARAVKLADNAENMDLGRIANPTEKDLARLKEYEQVRALLLAPSSD